MPKELADNMPAAHQRHHVDPAPSGAAPAATPR
jgi:hypothetical protein